VWHTEPGLYLDIVSGEVLFSSVDKLEPVAGFAEFSKPVEAAILLEQEATVSGEARLHVRSKAANSHLGWITNDEPGGARRYVINSSALRFVPVADLEKQGLGKFRPLLDAPSRPSPSAPEAPAVEPAQAEEPDKK
jgi:peptide methionine sulfoxide reductase MsrB